MAYYGMDFKTCREYHAERRWMPFMGQYWCFVCEKLRGNKDPDIEHAPSQDKPGTWQKGAALVRKLKGYSN